MDKFKRKQIQQNLRALSLILEKQRMKIAADDVEEKMEEILYELDCANGSDIGMVVVDALLRGTNLIERPSQDFIIESSKKKRTRNGGVIHPGL